MTRWRNVAVLAANSWQENLRSRFYLLAVVFGVVVLYVSLLLGLLASDQEPRVILDFGLGLIELLGLAGALHGATTVILREMETKTIYLILTRPVSRGEFLLGRTLGLLASALAAMLLMAAVHLSILFAKGWHWSPVYAWVFVSSFLKVAVTASLAVFLAVFSSSVLTALCITLILWALGHFLPEIRFMIAWGSAKGALAPLMALSYVVPDLEALNLRDRLSLASSAPPALPLWAVAPYALAYSAAWLALARLWLGKKEF